MTPRYQRPRNGQVRGAVLAVLTGLVLIAIPAGWSAGVWARDTLVWAQLHRVAVEKDGFDTAQFQALSSRQAAIDARVEVLANQIEEVRKIAADTNRSAKGDDARMERLVRTLLLLLKGAEQRAVLKEGGISPPAKGSP